MKLEEDDKNTKSENDETIKRRLFVCVIYNVDIIFTIKYMNVTYQYKLCKR